MCLCDQEKVKLKEKVAWNGKVNHHLKGEMFVFAFFLACKYRKVCCRQKAVSTCGHWPQFSYCTRRLLFSDLLFLKKSKCILFHGKYLLVNKCVQQKGSLFVQERQEKNETFSCSSHALFLKIPFWSLNYRLWFGFAPSLAFLVFWVIGKGGKVVVVH